MYFGDTNKIIECLSANWLAVVAWAASSAVLVAGITAGVVIFIMGSRAKLLEDRIAELESYGDRSDELSKKVAEYWKTLYEGCKANQISPTSSTRPLLVISLVLIGAIAGAVLTGFGARLYFAGPMSDLQGQLKDEQSKNTPLENQLSQLKSFLPAKAFDYASQQPVKSAQNFDANVLPPASLVDASGNRYKFFAKNGQRLHIVVQPIDPKTGKPNKTTDPSDSEPH
jgi:hypothetical protein